MSKPPSVPAGERRGPSMRVVIAIVAPTLALIAFLVVWAYQVRDWTWFSLLLAAAVGVSAFVVAPDLFSIKSSSHTSPPDEWCLTMTHGHRSDSLKPRTDVRPARDDRDRQAPNRSA